MRSPFSPPWTGRSATAAAGSEGTRKRGLRTVGTTV